MEPHALISTMDTSVIVLITGLDQIASKVGLYISLTLKLTVILYKDGVASNSKNVNDAVVFNLQYKWMMSMKFPVLIYVACELCSINECYP